MTTDHGHQGITKAHMAPMAQVSSNELFIRTSIRGVFKYESI